jgi:hypothetical protein
LLALFQVLPRRPPGCPLSASSSIAVGCCSPTLSIGVIKRSSHVTVSLKECWTVDVAILYCQTSSHNQFEPYALYASEDETFSSDFGVIIMQVFAISRSWI